jgi:hypothetical protein
VNPSRPVLWIDPGKITGIALWVVRDGGGFFCDEMDFDNAAHAIEATCERYGRELDVGWEHFAIFPKTPPADAHHAIEMIGVARRAQRRNGCRNVGPAQPEQRKSATMARLKAIGWWVPGKDDAQSAAQHLLAWMERTGCVPDEQAVTLAALRSRSGDDDLCPA